MKPLVVFAYNFPHKKTQDVLLYLFVQGYKVGWIFAANPVELNIPPHTVRTKIRHIALLHPRQIAERIGANYIVAPHNSREVESVLQQIKPELGIIAGARILKKPIISQFSIGIINLHPGLIPEARGLDAMLWSIYRDLPLGVTAHLIDERIDAGRVLVKETIPVYEDDTLLDLSERLYEKQLELLVPAIEAAYKGNWSMVDTRIPYNRKMPAELEREVLRKLSDFIAKFSGKKEEEA